MNSLEARAVLLRLRALDRSLARFNAAHLGRFVRWDAPARVYRPLDDRPVSLALAALGNAMQEQLARLERAAGRAGRR